MITRRGFISMLTIGAGAVLVPNRKWFLPARPFVGIDMAGDFDTTALIYKSTERYSGDTRGRRA